MAEEIEPPDVEYMTANLRKLQDARHQFAIKHGFAWKRPQHFKDCVVIHWRNRRRKDKNFIDYERINQYVDVAHDVCNKFNLNDPKDILQEISLKVLKGGIYCFSSWMHTVWAIPNSNAEVKAYVLEHLPAWADVKEK